MTTDEFKLALGKLIREMDYPMDATFVLAEVLLMMVLHPSMWSKS